MRLLLIALIIAITLYVTIYVFKICKWDLLDKVSLYYQVRYGYYNFEYSLENALQMLKPFFLIPFKPISFYSYFTEGCLYASYLYKYHPDIVDLCNDKLFWSHLFKQNNINHPKVYLYKLNNKITTCSEINRNKEYIVKPIKGCGGYKVAKIDGKDIEKYVEKNNNFLMEWRSPQLQRAFAPPRAAF